METETFLSLVIELKYLSRQEAGSALNLVTEISKMLTALRKRLLRP